MYENLYDIMADYKEFFDEAPIGLFRTEVETGRFLMANRYCAKLLGYDNANDLIKNEKITNLYPIEDHRRLIEAIQKQNGIAKYEIKLTLNGYKEIWVAITPSINSNGSYIEGYLVDITDQKITESAIKEEHAKLHRQMREINSKLNQALLAS